MVDFKLVISDPKTGKSYQREIKDPNSRKFLGLKINDSIKGESIDLTGYEFLVTGGSDNCGFPMRKDVTGTGRKRILIVKGVGLRKTKKGMRYRKAVCGNTIHSKISQINLKIVKEGREKLGKEEEMSETQRVSEHTQKHRNSKGISSSQNSENFVESKISDKPKEEKEAKTKEKKKTEEKKEKEVKE